MNNMKWQEQSNENTCRWICQQISFPEAAANILLTNTNMVLFSMEQLCSIQPIFLCTFQHIGLHLFFLLIQRKRSDKSGRCMELENCKKRMNSPQEIIYIWMLNKIMYDYKILQRNWKNYLMPQTKLKESDSKKSAR